MTTRAEAERSSAGERRCDGEGLVRRGQREERLGEAKCEGAREQAKGRQLSPKGWDRRKG